MPTPNKAQDPSYRRAAAKQLRQVASRRLARVDHADPELPHLDTHPLHHHPDRDRLLDGHRGITRLENEMTILDAEVQRRGSGLVRQFDAIVTVLERTGHVDGWALTPAGERLRRIYHECDLLLSLALERGLFDELDPPEVAALASCITFERRSSEPPPEPVLPSAAVRNAVRSLGSIADELNRVERSARAPRTRAPDAGFASAAWAWADGQDLDLILDEDLTGGDFVRNVRQLIDLLRQIDQIAAEPATRDAARQAAEALVRGVILGSGGPG